MNANRFKELREKTGLSQLNLGEKIGVTQQSVYAWERGDAMPKLQTAITLAALYNVSLDYLLGLSDDPQIESQSTAQNDGLDDEIIALARSLSPADFQRVKDFVSGLEAAREEPASPKQSSH